MTACREAIKVTVTLASGYDVKYLTRQVATGSENYYSAATYYSGPVAHGNEPPGRWFGKAAEQLGLTGEVDNRVFEDLFEKNVAPSGELIGRKLADFTAMRARAQEVIEQRIAEEECSGRRVLPERRRQIEFEELSKVRSGVAFFDWTLSPPKSVSVAWMSFRAAAQKARDAGDQERAAAMDARAGAIERALWAAHAEVLASVEAATYTRTGAGGREWRDTRGVVAAGFLQHTNREGDPQLHIHTAVLNRVQRGDMADDTWRTVDSRAWYEARLGVDANTNMALRDALVREGFKLRSRADGIEFEMAGVPDEAIDFFSSRRTNITAETAPVVEAFEEKYGRQPTQSELWHIRHDAWRDTRPGKEDHPPSPQEELAQWEAAYRAHAGAEVEEIPERIGSCTVSAPSFGVAERQACIEAAIAENQAMQSVWTEASLRRHLTHFIPPELASGDGAGVLLDELTAGALAQAEVVQIAPAPSVIDLRVLGVRIDGTPVVEKPGPERYTTQGQLDMEDFLVSEAGQRVAPKLTVERAVELVEAEGLTGKQAEAAVGMLTSDRAVDIFLAPAGAGKTFTLVRYAEAYEKGTGGKVVGLTSSAGAAEVLKMEGMPRTHTIADWLGKIKGSDETRGHLPIDAGDEVIIDESSQLSTADLAAIQHAVRGRGAHLTMTGDTGQQGTPAAGGALRMLAAEHGFWQVADVRRFRYQWERDASLRLRQGDSSVFRDYAERGRVWDGTREEMYNTAVHHWFGDFLSDRDVLLMATSNGEAAALARQARAKLIEYEKVQDRADVLLGMDENEASVGDQVMARENWAIDTGGGRPLRNRDVVRIDGWDEAGGRRSAVVRRREGPGRWSEPFKVPQSYLEKHAQLAYAANTHAAEGRTVDNGHMIISDTTYRSSKYVGLSRGREENTAYVVTSRPGQADLNAVPKPSPDAQREDRWAAAIRGEKLAALRAEGDALIASGLPADDPVRQEFALRVAKALLPEREPGEEERTSAQAVWSAADVRLAEDPTARDTIREMQEEAEGVPRNFDLWRTFTREASAGRFDAVAQERLSAEDFARYTSDPQRGALHRQLRAAEMGGVDPARLLADAASDRDLAGARSVAAVLHSRVARQWDPAQAPGLRSFTEATPADARDEARELAAALDAQVAEAGWQVAGRPPVWARARLGEVPADPVARADWALKAGRVSVWREVAGNEDPVEAVGRAPKAADPERHVLWRTAVESAGLPPHEKELLAASDGALYGRVWASDRLTASGPADVSERLHWTKQAIVFTESAITSARGRGDEADAANHVGLRDMHLVPERDQLADKDAARRLWWEETSPVRDAGDAARSELLRRGRPVDPPETKPAPQVKPEAKAEAEDPWAEAEVEEPEAEPEAGKPEPAPETPVAEPEPAPGAGPEPDADVDLEAETHTPEPEVDAADEDTDEDEDDRYKAITDRATYWTSLAESEQSAVRQYGRDWHDDRRDGQGREASVEAEL